MIRFVDGFDVCDFIPSAAKYSGFGAGSVVQGTMVSGRSGGHALNIVNTAFGHADWIQFFESEQTWGFHVDLFKASFNNVDVEWFHVGWSGGTLLAIRIKTDGKMDLIKSATGGVLATSNRSITLGSWTTIELKASFGTSGTVELRFDGDTVATASNVDFGSSLPDRLGFRWQSFNPGIALDNYAVWSGDDDFPGPLRVVTLLPQADATTSWTPSSGTSRTAMVADDTGITDGSPDGDDSYITPGTTVGQRFDFDSPNAPGLIVALAVNACVRPVVGDQTLDIVADLGSGETVLETKSVTPVGELAPGLAKLKDYFTYQHLVLTNGGESWTDADVANGNFGVAGNGSNIRVTAVYLEALCSLTLPPAGGAVNYSY